MAPLTHGAGPIPETAATGGARVPGSGPQTLWREWGDPRAALEVWTILLAERYGAVPGVDAEAREAITRVALSEARRAEAEVRA